MEQGAIGRKESGMPQKTMALQELFRWCLTEGQHLSEQTGYVPLPPNVVTAARAAVETLDRP